MSSDSAVDSFPVLVPVEEAERLVLESVAPLPVQRVPLAEAHGRYLAEDVRADHDIPAFDRSTMDGYAVRAGDVRSASRERPARLRVVEEIAAGDVPARRVEPGTASRIMTGAPIPDGADAVVRVEVTEQAGARVAAPPNAGQRSAAAATEEAAAPSDILVSDVLVYEPVPPGEAVGLKGSDVRAGARVLSGGARLGPVELGLLATFGVSEVPAYRKPRVAILSTGSELVGADEPVTPGKLRDSNSVMLAELVRSSGAEPLTLGIAPDRLDALAKKMEEALAAADVVVTSGGVSMGDYDYVGRAFERLGVRVVFWKTLMRPGKPILYGRRDGKSLFGLAGNPASSFANAHLFLLPAIRRMAGSATPRARQARALVDDPIEARDSNRTAFLRGTAYVSDGGTLRVRIAKKQSSGVLSSYLGANCLAEAPGRRAFAPGDAINVRWLGGQS